MQCVLQNNAFTSPGKTMFMSLLQSQSLDASLKVRRLDRAAWMGIWSAEVILHLQKTWLLFTSFLSCSIFTDYE